MEGAERKARSVQSPQLWVAPLAWVEQNSPHACPRLLSTQARAASICRSFWGDSWATLLWPT